MKLRTSLRALLVAPLALPLATLLTPTPTSLAAPAATSVKSAMKFTLPSGRVVYKMNSTGPRPANGTITMTWTNNGMPMRQDMEMNTGRPGSRVPPTSVWMIFDGHTAYVGMPAMMGKVALKMAPNSTQLKQMAGGISAVNSDAKGGKVVGKGTILGKPCEIRQVTANTPRGTSQSKLWLWQGLPLRTESTIKGTDGSVSTMTMVATKVDTTTKPSPSLFKVPADYKVQDMSAMLGQIMGSMGKQR